MARRVIWLVLLLGVLQAGPTRAQAPTAEPVYSRQPLFRIPFQVDAGDSRIQQQQLFYSIDQGKTWQVYANATPEQGSFQFRADHDGLYWFAVRTQDNEKRYYPATLDGLRAGLKVWVDTREPLVQVQPLPARDGSVGLSWTVRDENLDPKSLRLEQRVAGSAEWQSVASDNLQMNDQRYWNPGTNAPLEARLRARDRADNWGEGKVTLTAGNPYVQPDKVAQPVNQPAAAVRMVNTKQVTLEYGIRDMPVSGISLVELWSTQDGRTWQKFTEQKFDAVPASKRQSFAFEVMEEGLYGFTLLPRSGVQLGPRPPTVGEAPQVWVEVDLTKPVVAVEDATVKQEEGTLTVSWRASDKNLGRQPITLSYAADPKGPWTLIAANLENTGKYTWKMPPQGVPVKFHVRVEAADRAGNVASAETLDAVIADLTIPRIDFVDVPPQK